MAEPFDPYHKWLGIPPAEQPPHHYRLLGIAPFEADVQVVNAAVLQRTSYVRNFQDGPYADTAARLLNEIAAAQVCLLDRTRRAAYDAELRRTLSPAPRPAPADTSPIDAAWETAALAVARGLPLPAPRPRQARRPAWQRIAPIAAGAGAVLVLLWLLFGRGNGAPDGDGTSPEIAQSNSRQQDPSIGNAQRENHGRDPTVLGAPSVQQGKPANGSIPQASDQGATAAPNRGAPAASGSAPSGAKSGTKAESPPTPVATTTLPYTPPPEPTFETGVEADRIVIWNTNNGYDRSDRGAAVLKIELLRNGQAVQTIEKVAIPWDAKKDKSVEVKINPIRFDRLRVFVLEHKGLGGGLAEVQVFKGNRNLALGAPCVASSIMEDHFPASCITDGSTTSRVHRVGYWLLHHDVPGYIEIDLALSQHIRDRPVHAERVVIWNSHNGQDNNAGAQECHLRLWRHQKKVWEKTGIAMPWAANRDQSIAIDLPSEPFDGVSVEISKCVNSHGALAEVQVVQKGENLAAGCPVAGTSCYSPPVRPALLTDGVTTSAKHAFGYWLLPDTSPGLAYVDLRWSDRALRQKATELGLHLCVNQGAWARGLAWLARGANLDLARLAEADAAEIEQHTTNSPPTAVSLGDQWWALADKQDTQPTRGAFFARALFWYAKARQSLAGGERTWIERRFELALPHLPAAGYLYFWPEASSRIFYNHPRQHVTRHAGTEYAYALGVHPYLNEAAILSFSLPGSHKKLKGAVAIADCAGGRAQSGLVFKVLGDGRVLWTSAPLKEFGARTDFEVAIDGVRQLDLRVECGANSAHVHAAWLDPRIE